MSNLADKTKACPQCGGEFKIRSNAQKYCSKECRDAYLLERRKRIHREVAECSNRRDRIHGGATERNGRDAGACEFEIDIDMAAIKCDRCGYSLPMGTDLSMTRFCGGCGRKVRRCSNR